ncbi:MAG TPA: beta-ketoacyl-[acyl-carrier-protein] synthase family protein [Opitutaceae bacterium]|nr:beta-ketoacyl-[acyl-carrier-protein] synthase family protein [Opitutaceae bacterium]
MPSTAAITGLGFITSIGLTKAEVANRLRHGQSGLVEFDFCGNPRHPVKVAAPVPGFYFDGPNWREWSWPAGYEIPRETVRGLPPHGVYAFCAIEQALADAGLRLEDITSSDTGLFCASAGSPYMMWHHLEELAASQYERGHPLSVVSSIAGTLNFNLAAHFRITGAVAGFVSACTSGSHAIGYALDEIRLGRQQRMIVVAAEELNAQTDLPFAAMRALSTNPDPATASRPFDVERDGFVPTGGAVVLILEAPELAQARGAKAYAEISGWGQAADGYNVATSHPEGLGLRNAMLRAAKDAGIAMSDVDYINAHATSTPAGDRSEALALRSLIAPDARTIVSGTKGLTGHGLSMAGVMEAAFCALTFSEKFLPGNPKLVNPDPVCKGLNLPKESIAADPRIVMNNTSGFGGSNVCHVLRAPSPAFARS